LTSMVRKRVLEPAGDTLVQQDLHPNWPTRSDFASSRRGRDRSPSGGRQRAILTLGTASRPHDAEKTDIQPEATDVPGRNASGPATGFVRAHGKGPVQRKP
jgi:hypothetical protein